MIILPVPLLLVVLFSAVRLERRRLSPDRSCRIVFLAVGIPILLILVVHGTMIQVVCT